MAFAKAVIANIIANTLIAHPFARKLACLDPCHIALPVTVVVRQLNLRSCWTIYDLVKCQHLQMCDLDTLMQQFDLFTERAVHTVTRSCWTIYDLVKCQHLQMCDLDTLMQQFDLFTERAVHTVTSSGISRI